MEKKELLIKILAGTTLSMDGSYLKKIERLDEEEIKLESKLESNFYIATDLDKVLTNFHEGKISTEELVHSIENKHAATYKPGEENQVADSSMVGAITINGPIFYRDSELTRYFGIATVESIEAEFDAMMKNPKIGTIILNISSPGGTVSGVPELARKIYQAREEKRIVSIANPLAASAAYWLAAAAEDFYMIPSGSVGSIGVYVMHMDYSEYMKKEGIKVTFIYAGKKKVDFNPYEPLSDSAKADVQKEVDEINEDFVGSIAEFRGVSVKEVNASFGQGATFPSKEALSRKMINGIITPKELISQEVNLASSQSQGRAFINELKDFVQ